MLTDLTTDEREELNELRAEMNIVRAGALRGSVVLIPRFGASDTERTLFAAILARKNNRAVELPGGKPERGESAYDAAKREAEEELGVPVEVAVVPLGEFLHIYEGRVWLCTAYEGDLHGAHPRGSIEGDATFATRTELLAGTYGPVVRRILAAYDARKAGPRG